MTAPAAPRKGRARQVPTIWLHIGLNKTGTTALQNAFAAHRDTLRAHGVLYPETGIHANAHHPLAWLCGFHQGPPPPTGFTAEQLAESLKAEFARTPDATVLLSSEFLSLPGDIRQLKQLLKPADFRVVVYLRRHDAWLQSVYVQAVKTVMAPRWGRGMQNYLKLVNTARRPIGRYRALLDEWAGFFGASSIVVRPFERSQVGDALHLDLLRAMGCDEAAAALPAALPRENESVSFEAVNLIDIVTHSRLPLETRGWIRDMVLRADPGTQRGVHFLSPAERLAQIQANADDYAHIARTYLGRDDGVLFRDPLPDADAPWTAPQQPTPIWVAERMAGYLALADSRQLEPLRSQAFELIAGTPATPPAAPAPAASSPSPPAGDAHAKAVARARR